MSSEEIAFKGLVWQKGHELYRDMPWRRDTRPYFVLVSELMLQQTQVDRVMPKFEAFIDRFPDEKILARASLADVLRLWNGLGYNRRAKYLHDTARMIATDFNGEYPEDYANLVKLPGIGHNTAGAILTYAFNQPVVFIETNVRTVYFHHFFPDGNKVDDKEITKLLERTLDREHPREFYWALMDYGTWLKRQGAGRVAQSRHYVKQPALKGSVREVRGHIVRVLAKHAMSEAELRSIVQADYRFLSALEGLRRDGLVQAKNQLLYLTK